MSRSNVFLRVPSGACFPRARFFQSLGGSLYIFFPPFFLEAFFFPFEAFFLPFLPFLPPFFFFFFFFFFLFCFFLPPPGAGAGGAGAGVSVGDSWKRAMKG